jgi:hypothetical protein
MAKQTFSVDVPTNPDDLIALAAKLLAKDTALGANSPFKNIKNWSAFTGLNGTADTNNTASNTRSIIRRATSSGKRSSSF